MKWAAVLTALALLLGTVAVGARGLEPEPAGKSAVLMEVETGTVLYARNEREKLAPASVTKVMTMLLIMEALDSGALNWEDRVTASETAAAKGGSQVYLKAGESMTVRDMLKAIAVSSANDCACAMAEQLAGSEGAFAEQMNRRAEELGMTDTHFVNCTGLDDSPEAENHRTSARDIALMSRQLLKYHPDITQYTTIWMDTLREGTFGLSNTNKLVRFYPGATGLKTGFTSGAGYCLSASAQREGMQLIAVVMGAKTSAERFSACKGLLDQGFASHALVYPETCEAQPVPVKLGRAASVTPVLGEASPILVEKGKKNAITMTPTLTEVLAAPVAQGQRLGTLTVKAGEELLAQLELVAAEAVPRLTFGELFCRVLRMAAMAKSA